jgi:hypothetical protein
MVLNLKNEGYDVIIYLEESHGGKMEIREIREIHSDKIWIKIPKEFREKRVEIVVSSIEDTVEKPRRFSRFLKSPIKIEKFRMPSREERNDR